MCGLQGTGYDAMVSDISEALTTSQIECALKYICESRRYFNGVYSYDNIPIKRIENRPALVVVNTAYSRSDGEHWQAFFL